MTERTDTHTHNQDEENKQQERRHSKNSSSSDPGIDIFDELVQVEVPVVGSLVLEVGPHGDHHVVCGIVFCLPKHSCRKLIVPFGKRANNVPDYQIYW